MRRLLAALLPLALLAGCSTPGGFAPHGPSSAAGRTASSPPPESDPATTVTRSLSDVERFWQDAYPRLSGGTAFRKVTGGYHPYTRRTPAPSCGGQRSAYQPNAFYCPDGDFIAWDAQNLIPELQKQFGPVLVGVVMAHEYGHAIQTRLGRTDQPTVVLEQQADCYAGAWLADVLGGRSAAFGAITATRLDDTVAGVLQLRDQPGTAAQDDAAHGNAFDRIRAVQDGVEKGVTTCAGYTASTLPVTEVPFSSRREAASGGELAYDTAIDLLAADAQTYWQRTYPSLTGKSWGRLTVRTFTAGEPPACDTPDATADGAAFYCPDGDFVAFDATDLGPQLYAQIGDFAVGMLLGDLFARAAQGRRGADTRDRAGQLTVDCLAGSWTNDLLTRTTEQNVRLSPGDLDEAVSALLAFGRAGDQGGQGGGQGGPTAFDRIASYRTGTLSGLDACG